MITTNHEPIPKEKLYQFQDILGRSGGRFLSNPYEEKDCYRVSYSFDDVYESRKFNHKWNLVTQEIIEKRSDQWWRILGRRIYQAIFKNSIYNIYFCI